MVTTELVSRSVNTIADRESEILGLDAVPGEEQHHPIEQLEVEAMQDNGPVAATDEVAEDDPEMPVLDFDGNNDPDDEDGDDVPATRRSARVAAGVKPPERLTLATKVRESEWKEEETAKAIKDEVQQLFTELKALEPTKDIPRDTKILRSHMFVVEKFLASGEHDKMKARLVADGRGQDPSLYPDKSSPTVSIHSLFTVLAMYAGTIGYLMGKVDIKGAFVQTPMEGEPVYMRTDKKVAKHVLELYPEYSVFVQDDGSIVTKLLKAMYGCVQASRLWFNLLTKVLRTRGYVASEIDPCVMRREVDDMIFIILIYVDDLLIFASAEEMEALRHLLIAAFKSISMQVLNALSYLGMQISWQEGRFSVEMDFYVEQLLKDWMHVPKRSAPGTKDTFKLNLNSMLLEEPKRKVFHTMVARVLYVSKRVRPDILVVTSFLCTRVTRATKLDQAKLERLLGYLTSTMGKRLIIRARNNVQIRAFIDASFALHDDSKSHTGFVFYVGGAVIYVSSRKQKCIAKSPTEAELVGLTDNLGLVELFHEFISFLSGKKAFIPVVYQDSNSVISLITIGGGVTRTKHMRARMNLAKESIEEKRVSICYLNTKEMPADGASKVLEGADFQKHADFVQGKSLLAG